MASAKRSRRGFRPRRSSATSHLALIGPLAGSHGGEAGDWQGVCAAGQRAPRAWGRPGAKRPADSAFQPPCRTPSGGKGAPAVGLAPSIIRQVLFLKPQQ